MPCSWSPASPAWASTSCCSHEERLVIQILLWAPLAAGLLACAVPRRACAWVALIGPLATLVLAIVVVARFDPSGGMQHTVDESWIPTLGVRYQLGIDGISLFL